MGSFEEMEVNKRVLQQLSLDLQAAIVSAKALPNVGKTLGLKIPDDLRARLDAQSESWDLKNHKKTVLTAVLLGLHQMEEMHKLKGKEPSNVGRQDSVQKVSRVFGTNGSRDSYPRGS